MSDEALLRVVGMLGFLSPAHEVGTGDIVITMFGHASVFRFRTISLKPLARLLSYCLGGVDVPFGVMAFDLVFTLGF